MGKKYNSSSISSLNMEASKTDTKITDNASNNYSYGVREQNLTENLLDCNESEENLDEQKVSKHMRQRKRKLYNQVREQMEFYFSDANLSKDRYLMQRIRENEYVSLDIFLNFNKIKKVLKTSNELVKALSSSTVLQLNESKTHVSRIKPVTDLEENSEEVDARTIYVESLPANADHEWIKKVFTHVSNGGIVTYVSLPKYRNSRKLKEFGFVEFESVESVQKCLNAFREFDGILHHEHLDPIDLLSVKSFIEENKCDENPIYQNDYNYKNKKDKLNNFNKSKSQVVISDMDDKNDTKPKSKRIKLDESYETKSSKSDIGSFGITESDSKLNKSEVIKKKKLRKKKKKDKRKKTVEKPTTTDSRPLNLDIDLKDLKVLPKKQWKRLRNNYLNLQREQIRLLKKKNWLKNHDNDCRGNSNKKQIAAVKHISRLNQQIAASTSLQQQSQLIKLSPHAMRTSVTPTNITTTKTATTASIATRKTNTIVTTASVSTTTTVTTASTTSNISGTLNGINVKHFELKKSPHMNFYRVNKEIDGGLYDEDENDSQSNDTSSLDSPGINSPYSMLEKRRKLLSPITNSTKTEIKRSIAQEKEPLFHFEPGIIVKVEFSQPCVDIKSFKNDMKQCESIKYVDVKEGSMVAHIRCDTTKNAQDVSNNFLIKNYINQNKILDGTEESKYWDKIMQDRDMKLNKRVILKPKRGRTKITKLISNHTRFVDNED